MNQKPIFFEIAKYESTQDGFIAWLLEWANPVKWTNDALDWLFSTLVSQSQRK